MKLARHQKTFKFLLTPLLLALLLGGCSSYMADQKQMTRTELVEAVESRKERPPADIEAQLLNSVMPQKGATLVRSERRFDIRARRLRARDFFLSLVEGTSYDVVIDPDVGGYISLELKQATVLEVLEVVRNSHGYDYQIDKRRIDILPNRIQTRIFQLDYLSLNRSGTSNTSAGSGGSSGGEGSGRGGTSTITTESSNDLWTQIEASIKSVLTSSEGSSYTIIPQTGMVVVRALPGKLREVANLLNQSQRILQRQVILEARIIEVELNSGFQSGINWLELQRSNGTTYSAAQPGLGASLVGTQRTTSNPNSVASAFDTSVNGTFSLGVSSSDFTTFINLLKTQGEVHVLSSPKISTINNQKAVIKVGADEFFVNDFSTSTDANGIVTPTFSLETFFSGVALDVTPQIDANDNIVLHVHPTVSEVTEQQKSIGSYTVPLAKSNIRESDTIIRARNGEVVVIGGLMQSKSVDSGGKVPILGDIPILGWLFSTQQESRIKSELVILIKPTVIDNEGEVWDRERNATMDRLNNMEAQEKVWGTP